MAETSSERATPASNPRDFGGDLAAEIAQIRQDIGALGKTLGSAGKARLDALPEAAAHSAEETMESARQALKEIRREVSTLEQRLKRGVVDHPVQSLLVAVGLGFLVAFLIRR
ncbi:MAG: hypothetical protein WAT09_03980 [Paracoccaceae bacterium]